jgi:uncharacterized protein YggE
MRLLTGAMLAACLLAQETPLLPPHVRAYGTATATAKPDQVRIDIGVVSQAQTAQAASAANAKQLTEVLAELKKTAGGAADIRTLSYSVHPIHKYPREGGSPAIVGYSATNIVQVTSPDVDGAGKIIDAATRTGANTIQGIQFMLKDEQPLRAQALRDAVKQARASADAMAAALGMKIVNVLRIEDAGRPEVHPVREMAMMQRAAADAPTPVEPATIRVTATVTVTASIGH